MCTEPVLARSGNDFARPKLRSNSREHINPYAAFYKNKCCPRAGGGQVGVNSK